ncbi:DUF541 domain-containing protein [Paraburkholderia sp. UCT31]|uniref:SIMPL domain-containing protein n=1 Tax=Paraburkholderia sp. UCT31 TaxID=2615209 RepID=UPI0016556D6F|nr:SIMPL domain-containing protein [Paraburkholderia sp. UCT31]MBC8737111.1 DUF541 domain-containing protein [Paraburkholderia sp. UCT31]
MKFTPVSLFVALMALAGVANAETAEGPIANFNARATVDVPQDTARADLYAEASASTVAAATEEVNRALKEGLTLARDVHGVTAKTGSFRSFPTYDQKQKVTGYRVHGDLSVESHDFDAFSQVLTRLSSGLLVSNVAYSLSEQEAATAASKAMTQASANFKAQASLVAKSLGYSSYDIKEISVNSDSGFVPRPVMAMARMSEATRTAAQVEPGTTSVTVTVNGSVRLK